MDLGRKDTLLKQVHEKTGGPCLMICVPVPAGNIYNVSAEVLLKAARLSFTGRDFQ